jgi:N utilization substance protein A
VQTINATGVTIGLEMKAEGVMPNNQRIPGEKLKLHDRVRAVVIEVKDGTRGPQIILSRAHRNFLRRLMENEVPEIYHGIVEIRAIAREPGARAKVAVSATQPGIDPVGACVGMKGVRIQAIVKELHDEKIDIIQWDQDPVVYISKAISPARVSGVYLAEEEGARTATVVVGEDQLSLAIGRDGQNARLAAKLTGWRIDIKSLTEASGDALGKMQGDPELAAMLPAARDQMPQVEEILAKKAEGRPVTPEEYTVLGQFVDRVERRMIQVKEEATRVEEERVAAASADIPAVAFTMTLDQATGIKEHVFNILTEAGYETVGQLMFDIRVNPNKVLGLAGIGSKAIQNIEESLAALTFPEPVKEEPVAVETAAPEVVAEPESAAEMPVAEKAAEKKKEAKKVVEEVEEDGEVSKDGVSLDELFQMKPEMFQAAGEEDDASGDKKKDKKGKKKGVALEFDESLGEVVTRKKHKRGGEDEVEW